MRERKMTSAKERFKINVLLQLNVPRKPWRMPQSVSALCSVNLLKTEVVGSNPDDGSFLFCLFIFSLALHRWWK